MARHVVRGDAVKVDWASLTDAERERIWQARERQAAASRRSHALLMAAGECELIRRWYALRVVGGREKMVSDTLDGMNIHNWVPMRKQKAWRVRGRVLPSREAPVISGFVFVRVISSAECWAGLRTVRGVFDVVGTADAPMPIADKEMQSFNDLAKGGAFDEDKTHPEKTFALGEKLHVAAGPFAGFEGRVMKHGKGRQKDMVLVGLALFTHETPTWLPIAILEKS